MKTYTHEEMKKKDPEAAMQVDLYEFCRDMQRLYIQADLVLENANGDYDNSQSQREYYQGQWDTMNAIINSSKRLELWRER